MLHLFMESTRVREEHRVFQDHCINFDYTCKQEVRNQLSRLEGRVVGKARLCSSLRATIVQSIISKVQYDRLTVSC
jgi:hypothetical protein